MPKRVLYIADNDWFFISHRLQLALAAKESGYEVWVIAGDTGRADQIRSLGLNFRNADLIRKRIDPFREIQICWRLYRIYRQLKPDIVHHISLKIILVGSLAARLAGIKRTVNAVTGLGHFFIDPSKRRMVDLLFAPVLKALARRSGSRYIFQNPEDLRLFIARKWAAGYNSIIIKGSGIDLKEFRYHPEPDSRPVLICCATRLLKEKGIPEFADAARILTAKWGSGVCFILAGRIIAENPSGISPEQIHAWEKEGILNFKGFAENMPAMLAASHINVLPSYREGLPRSLIEACAVGRPIVSTNVPGCRDVVEHGVNGFLVPAGDAEALAEAIDKLIADAQLRLSMGRAARKKAEEEFGIERVIRQTLDLYAAMQEVQAARGQTAVSDEMSSS